MTGSFSPERQRITALRLTAQSIAEPRFAGPAEVVRHMLALQAQDFPSVVWAIGLRTTGTTDAVVESAIADATIVRSWPMRGTLHVVPAEDLGWMLALTGERTMRSAAARYRQLGLGDPEFALARSLAESALADGPIPRSELLSAFEAAGLPTAGLGGSNLLQWLALSRVTVFGPVVGKQHSFALFDDWIRDSRQLSGDEALAEFALRYLTSHGPATARDLSWWSSLTLTDARRGIAAVADRLEVDGDSYWAPGLEPAEPGVWALPGFDEFLLGYQDRSAPLHLDHAERIVPGGNGIFLPTIVVDGEVVGTWKRSVRARQSIVEPLPFARLTRAQSAGFDRAVARYGDFVGKPVLLA